MNFVLKSLIYVDMDQVVICKSALDRCSRFEKCEMKQIPYENSLIAHLPNLQKSLDKILLVLDAFMSFVQSST